MLGVSTMYEYNILNNYYVIIEKIVITFFLYKYTVKLKITVLKCINSMLWLAIN